MKDFTPIETVTCQPWTALVTSHLLKEPNTKSVPAILASCQGQCKLTGLRWDVELVRAEDGQEWMRLNFNPIDQADYPKLYDHLVEALNVL